MCSPLCNALIKSCCPVALLCDRADLAQRYVELLLQHTSAHPLFMWHPGQPLLPGAGAARAG